MSTLSESAIDFPETKINTESKLKRFPFPIAEFIRAHSVLIRSGSKRNTLTEANLFNERLVSKIKLSVKILRNIINVIEKMKFKILLSIAKYFSH